MVVGRTKRVQGGSETLAMVVFPPPGGPTSRMPREGSMPNRWKVALYRIGHSTVSINFCKSRRVSPLGWCDLSAMAKVGGGVGE
jgi:hypothetical protein